MALRGRVADEGDDEQDRAHEQETGPPGNNERECSRNAQQDHGDAEHGYHECCGGHDSALGDFVALCLGVGGVLLDYGLNVLGNIVFEGGKLVGDADDYLLELVLGLAILALVDEIGDRIGDAGDGPLDSALRGVFLGDFRCGGINCFGSVFHRFDLLCHGRGHCFYDVFYDVLITGGAVEAYGVPYDVRTFGQGAYGKLSEFTPITSEAGDCYGRMEVRAAEVLQSIDIIDELIATIPAGDISVPVKGAPAADGQASTILEQPRGEAFYYALGNGSKFLERMRIRTPTSQNLAGMVTALKGCDLTDVNMIILTIDPCISCTER